MIHLSKKTKKPVQEIRKRADAYFGTDGLGLDAVDAGECSGCYEGGGGFVSIDIQEDDQQRTVDIRAKEWEFDAKRFLRKI